MTSEPSGENPTCRWVVHGHRTDIKVVAFADLHITEDSTVVLGGGARSGSAFLARCIFSEAVPGVPSELEDGSQYYRTSSSEVKWLFVPKLTFNATLCDKLCTTIALIVSSVNG